MQNTDNRSSRQFLFAIFIWAIYISICQHLNKMCLHSQLFDEFIGKTDDILKWFQKSSDDVSGGWGNI